ncbi:lachesin-like [Mytilus edulis]|uniref:lachesin-like n=1 Tax=Mytilus edulis TaxID=6550 RepID=UPI0039EF7327
MAIIAMNSTWCIIFLAVSYFDYIPSTLAVKQTVFVKKGLTVDLSCPFQAVTNPIIWRGPPNLKRYSINNNINSHIGKLDRISVNGNLTTQKYILSISNFTTTDAGLYRCETILNQTSKRHEIEVHLAVSPVVRVNVEPSSVVEEGHNLTLTCLYDSNTNESVICWKRNDRILLNTQNSTLSVINVSREDAGKYCCEVENRIGIGTDMINITVLYKPRVMSHSNTLEIESDFEKPSFISFTIASGTKPNISWTNIHGGKIGYWNVQDIGEEIFNVTSTIFPFEKSHLGQYSVRVRNKIGSIDLNIELVGFKVNVFPTKLICNVTDKIELTCNISQYATSNLSNIWIHSYEGKEIRSLQGSIEKISSKLRIPFCDYRDAGTYTCMWKSSMIMQSCSSTIYVQSHPVLTSIQTFKQNGSTTLTVRFVSFPPPLEVIWFYKDQPILKPILSVGNSLQKKGVKLQIKTKMILVNGYVTSYQIKETRNSAVGHYSCKVMNIIGNLDVSFSEPNITRKEGLRNNTSTTGKDFISF